MKTKINHEAIFKLAIKGFSSHAIADFIGCSVGAVSVSLKRHYGIDGGPNAVYKLAKATAPHAARKNTAKQQKGCALFGIFRRVA